CVDAQLVDVIPAGLDIVSLPQSIPGQRTVVFDAATRTLTVTFIEILGNPSGRKGLNAGATRNLFVGVRLPVNTPVLDGTSITNTGELSAANAPAVTAAVDVPVTVPQVVRPVAKKTWSDGSAVAGSAEAGTIGINISNQSSSSAQVTQLVATDATPSTWNNFDFTGATVAGLPAGADVGTLQICTIVGGGCADGQYQSGAPTNGATPLSLPLPVGVSNDQVTGVRVVFANGAGSVLPVDLTGGNLAIGTVLRGTDRASGLPIAPATRQTVANCASPSAGVGGTITTGADSCKGYDILPNLVVFGSSKRFFPDTNGNFEANANEFAVLGQNSPVSAIVTVQNKSPFPIGSLTVTEPGAQPSEFNKLDVSDFRVLLPAGATAALVTVTCRSGPNPLPTTFTANQNKLPTGCTGPAASVSVTYTGAIAANATATLGVAGQLNDLVDSSDVATPQNPGNGVSNCADYSGSTSVDGSGSTSGSVCATLPIQLPRTASPGIKTISQTSVPAGQPVLFGLPVINNGNLPLVMPGVADPQVDGAGNPATVGNPFASLRITAVTVTKSGGFTGDVLTEIFDPGLGQWVSYATASPAQLSAATGVRSRATGNLNPGQGFTTTLSTVRRDGVPDGQALQNCVYTIGADGTQYPGIDPWCSPSFVTGAQSASASIAKSITPSSLPRPIPGLPQQLTQVKLAIANNGNLNLRQIQTQDSTPAFFDAVDFLEVDGVNFPAGANQVRLDVCTSVADCAADAFQPGPATSGTPALPVNVTPAQVLGVRFVFSNTNAGFSIVPGATFPNTGPCAGASVCYSVAPRQTLRSDPNTLVPSALQNTATGRFASQLDPGVLKSTPDTQATLTLVPGAP
ncbi:MAG: isopeptide-forming domain-containing fimbrial protein, partial [Nakamurella sp.]